MNPVFVSVGHMILLQSAIEFTFENVKNHKFPEALKLAHQISKDEREK
jgi:deoxyinosine 3'endonuclease (endonuclease V)